MTTQPDPRLVEAAKHDPTLAYMINKGQCTTKAAGIVAALPFDDGELVQHEAEQEAIREMVALRAEGKPLRAIAVASQPERSSDSHEGVPGVREGPPTPSGQT